MKKLKIGTILFVTFLLIGCKNEYRYELVSGSKSTFLIDQKTGSIWYIGNTGAANIGNLPELAPKVNDIHKYDSKTW